MALRRGGGGEGNFLVDLSIEGTGTLCTYSAADARHGGKKTADRKRKKKLHELLAPAGGRAQLSSRATSTNPGHVTLESRPSGQWDKRLSICARARQRLPVLIPIDGACLEGDRAVYLWRLGLCDLSKCWRRAEIHYQFSAVLHACLARTRPPGGGVRYKEV